jgi:hypothetical protein
MKTVNIMIILISNRGFCTHQVVTEELHDEGGVLVALLAQSVELYRKEFD